MQRRECKSRLEHVSKIVVLYFFKKFENNYQNRHPTFEEKLARTTVKWIAQLSKNCCYNACKRKNERKYQQIYYQDLKPAT